MAEMHTSSQIISLNDDTVLHMKIYMGEESIAIGIIEASSQEQITKANKFGNTALHEAVATGCVPVVKKLLQKAPKLLDTPNKKGERPLYTAAHFGQTEIFNLLAEQLKNVPDLRVHFCSMYPAEKHVFSYHPQRIRSTILHAAIHAEFFELALSIAKTPKYAKTVQQMDKNSKTPLHLLSSNSSAFKSGMKYGQIKRFIYNCAPYEDANGEYAHEQNSSDDTNGEDAHKQNSKRSATLFRILRRVISSVNRSVWNVLRAWSTMKNIYDEKKRHGLAFELAKILIVADHSWDVTRVSAIEGVDETARENVPRPDSNNSDGETTNRSPKKNTPPIPLYIATEHGIFEILKEILTVHKAAYEYRNTKDQNILHLAIMHRQWKIFELVIDMDGTRKRLIRQLDTNNFTVLHHVGNVDYYNGGTQPGPALQLQEELKWFEKVKALMPQHYQKFRAREDKDTTPLQSFHERYVEILKDLSKSENIAVDKITTPDDPEGKKYEIPSEIPKEYFRRTHDPLLNSAREWLKRTSESCSTVAGLMATVAFTAAFTVPGGNDEQSGTPRLLHSPFFLVFVITDALSLASSLTSLVMFLSILTSPFELEDFRHSLPRKLILGFTFLFLSVVVTMVAFASTLMLTISMKNRVTKIFVYCVAFLPVSVFALLQFPLWVAFKKSLEAMQSVWRSILPATHSKTAKTQ
ncbi:hypothetical protein ACLB2K_024427 [Fragaria x ananassa]